MEKLPKINIAFICLSIAFIISGIVLFAACENSQEVPPVVVTEVFNIAGEEIIVTRIVELTPTPTAVPTAAPEQQEPVVLDLSYVRNGVPNIDPQVTDDQDGIDLVENMFVGLTRYNHATNQVDPALAESWEVSGDGRIWTFSLRDDIFWVRPSEEVVDDYVISEAVRPVVASDIVFAVQRTCARETNSPDAFILFLVEGCEQVHQLATATPADLANIGVRAVNDTTLQIRLNRSAAHFLTITSLWFMRPLPRELFEESFVEEYGSDWQTAVQNGAPLLTSGPFMPLATDFTTLQRNTLWPIPFQGNSEIVKINYVDSDDVALLLWQAKSLDLIDATDLDLDALPPATLQQLQQISQQTVFYLNFNFQSGIFREPNVRRAFSAAINREELVEEVFGQAAVPMRHLVPPGVIGGMPIDQVGIGYSPDFARLQMAESGFLSCRQMPEIRFMVSSSDLSLLQAELLIQMWIEELGCQESQFKIEQVPFGTLLANTRADAGAARPDIWELAWASYFPDAQNWMGDLLHCQESENRERRACSDVDMLIREAATTVDIAKRLELYRQIENMLFGDEGITPLAPLYARANLVLVQDWLTYQPSFFGGEQFDTYEVEVARKELERSRSQ
ncbi:peptide ABC transporter substrate-binding protein [Candidatus Leptofilum sp.]|uniref:peptide ABC transporter substrate-binding protein n=1 Tax=Candidatus Leptofilum sp. TaxID=3241576 RepID=UPI003B5B63AA